MHPGQMRPDPRSHKTSPEAALGLLALAYVAQRAAFTMMF